MGLTLLLEVPEQVLVGTPSLLISVGQHGEAGRVKMPGGHRPLLVGGLRQRHD